MSLIDTKTLELGTHNIIDVKVWTVGIKKRCRSVDSHTLKVGYFKPDTDRHDLIKIARDLVSKEMKQNTRPARLRICKAQLEITPTMQIFKTSSDNIFKSEEYNLE